jgi:hypothetical protein
MLDTTTRVWMTAAAIALAVSTQAANAHAADDGEGGNGGETTPRTAPNSTPITAYTYNANGAPSGTIGASTYGVGATGVPSNGAFSGGGTAWVSPIDRLTIVVDAQRDVTAQFTPSAAAIVRLLGVPNQGWSLGALGKFKIDGFARGPNKEIESEVESGLLLSYGKNRLHFDLNAITGVGLGDDREIDQEARLRLGFDVHRMVRLGIDEQARFRLHGINKLPGNRTWDFAGGPQVLVSWKNFFSAVTAGPTTMGVVDTRVGWMAMLSIGGVTL